MSTASKLGLTVLSNVKQGLTFGNWGCPDVDDWLIRASMGANATPSEMLEKMLSPEDIEDLKEGRLSFECLKCHVQVWCEMRKPNQNSRQATKEEVKEASAKVIHKYGIALKGLSKR